MKLEELLEKVEELEGEYGKLYQKSIQLYGKGKTLSNKEKRRINQIQDEMREMVGVAPGDVVNTAGFVRMFGKIMELVDND